MLCVHCWALLAALLLEKTAGKNRAAIRRRHGKQEHMMPTLISIEDQIAAGALS